MYISHKEAHVILTRRQNAICLCAKFILLYSSFLLYLQKFNVRLYNQYNRYFDTCVLSKVQLSKQREFVGAYSILFLVIDSPQNGLYNAITKYKFGLLYLISKNRKFQGP